MRVTLLEARRALEARSCQVCKLCLGGSHSLPTLVFFPRRSSPAFPGLDQPREVRLAVQPAQRARSAQRAAAGRDREAVAVAQVQAGARSGDGARIQSAAEAGQHTAAAVDRGGA